MHKIFRIFAVFSFAMLFIAISSIAEEVTLTTYYPAPYGVYEELETSKLAVGSSTSMPAGDGTINAVSYSVNGNLGASGAFTTVDGKTVTVENGIIKSIAQ